MTPRQQIIARVTDRILAMDRAIRDGQAEAFQIGDVEYRGDWVHHHHAEAIIADEEWDAATVAYLDDVYGHERSWVKRSLLRKASNEATKAVRGGRLQGKAA